MRFHLIILVNFLYSLSLLAADRLETKTHMFSFEKDHNTILSIEKSSKIIKKIPITGQPTTMAYHNDVLYVISAIDEGDVVLTQLKGDTQDLIRELNISLERGHKIDFIHLNQNRILIAAKGVRWEVLVLEVNQEGHLIKIMSPYICKCIPDIESLEWDAQELGPRDVFDLIRIDASGPFVCFLFMTHKSGNGQRVCVVNLEDMSLAVHYLQYPFACLSKLEFKDAYGYLGRNQFPLTNASNSANQ